MSDSTISSEKLFDAIIKPLTKSRMDGELMQRPPEVTGQIVELLSLEKSEFIRNLNVTDKTSSRFVKDECLIYFFRESLADSGDALDKIIETLTARIQNAINTNVRKFAAKEHFDDCVDEIISEIFGQLCDVDSNKNDFAQVRFGMFLKRFCSQYLKKYAKQRGESNITNSIDAVDAETNTTFDIAAPIKDYDGVDFQDVKKGLQILPEQIRTAFILKNTRDWKIESQNPDEITLSKHFNKSGRTIRNWLERAEILLAEWREKQR